MNHLGQLEPLRRTKRYKPELVNYLVAIAAPASNQTGFSFSAGPYLFAPTGVSVKRSELTMIDKHYWFPAMRYGFGWGLPITWQGWLSMIAVIDLAALGGLTIPERYGVLVFVCYDVVLVSLFLGLCWWKGEPPKWLH